MSRDAFGTGLFGTDGDLAVEGDTYAATPPAGLANSFPGTSVLVGYIGRSPVNMGTGGYLAPQS